MKRLSIFCLILVNLLFTTVGCTTVPSPQEFQKYLEDPQAPRLVIQICLPDKTTYFDDLKVDVTDLPADIPPSALQKLFYEANAYKAGEGFINPYQSNSPNREYQPTRLWRKPANPTDYPNYWIAAGAAENVKGIMSAGSIPGGYLVDSTEKNQPVFLGFTSQRPTDVIGVSVTLPKDENGELREFWFKVPKEIRNDQYTNWISPVSEEGITERSAPFPTFWLLTHGKDMPLYQVKPNSPQMRFTLMTTKEYYHRSEYGRRAINAAQLQHMKDKPSDNEHHHYVPEKRESIPSCASGL